MIDMLKYAKNLENFKVWGVPVFFLFENETLVWKYLIYKSSLIANQGI